MFTGLIEAKGIVLAMSGHKRVDNGVSNAYSRMRIGCPHIVQSGIAIGDSICVNGACLTAVRQSSRMQRLVSLLTKKPQHAWFEVEMLETTLEKTSLSTLAVGGMVNLERAMLASQRMGGHVVTGHVACVASVESVIEHEENCFLTVKIPARYMKYMIREGSIALDGISLTIAETGHNSVTCCIIPHTKAVTNLRDITEKDVMNVEPDIVARYIENMVYRGKNTMTEAWSMQTSDNIENSAA